MKSLKSWVKAVIVSLVIVALMVIGKYMFMNVTDGLYTLDMALVIFIGLTSLATAFLIMKWSK